MQTVKRSWLLLLNWVLVGLDLALFVGYLCFRFLPTSQSTIELWGITPVVLILAGGHLVYAALIYPWLSKARLWFATLISFSAFGFLISSIIETSQTQNDYYRALFILFVFFMNMGGIVGTIVAITLSWIIYSFTILAIVPTTAQSTLKYTVINCLVTIAGALGWLVFKRFYISTTAKEVAQISSLLEQEQFKSNTILESINDGVMVIATSGTVQVLNESAANMLGWTQAEAKKLDYRTLVQVNEEEVNEKTKVTTAISQTLTTQETSQQVSLLHTRHNHNIYVDIVASPIFQTLPATADSKETRQLVDVIAVLRNVDTQRRQEQQRSDFISTASHEMRTPVAAIQGYLELALNPKVCQIDPKATSYLQKAHESTKHLGQLFQDLLTVSKSDDGRLTNKPELINITEFLQEVIEPEVMAAEQKGLRVSFESGPPTSGKRVAPLLYVTVDRERLKEVILNLFENAIKYTPAGLITVGASSKDQAVVIRIADTGIGIAEEDISHLFQKFYRTDNSATRQIGGTGLGLYICKQIIEMMGGRIWVESSLGAGSTFFVQLPRVPANLIGQQPTNIA